MKSEEMNLSDDANNPTAFEGAITEALEQRPEISVPGDFTARLMSRLPQKQASADAFGERREARVGRTVGYASAAATTVALIALAMLNPAAIEAGKTIAFAVEMLLVAELLGVGLWLGTRRDA